MQNHWADYLMKHRHLLENHGAQQQHKLCTRNEQEIYRSGGFCTKFCCTQPDHAWQVIIL